MLARATEPWDTSAEDSMGEELASTNLNRSYALAATNISIFTFLLFFLYPRFENGRIDPLLFQSTLVAMSVATFSLVFASLHYYRSSLSGRMTEDERARYSRRADRFWLVGYTVMFLAPSVVLFSIRLVAVASVWLALWLVYLGFVFRFFPKVQTPRTSL
jgi:hypothetical protein